MKGENRIEKEEIEEIKITKQNNFFKCGKYNLELGQRKYVMGILNVTPDSFSDGGMWFNTDLAVKRALKIQEQGADILDIGAQSTRPGYIKISPQNEWERIEYVFKRLSGKMKIPVSIDTFYPEVAEKALDLGADIINDVTGFNNKEMLDVASQSDCGLVIMHPGQMKTTTEFFKQRIDAMNEKLIDLNRICLDPGIGFGKTYMENLFILANTENFRIKDRPILVGASRKRVIGDSCGNPPFEDRLPGTISAHVASMLFGADIVRVHDVSEAVQSARVIEKIIKAEKSKENHSLKNE